ncbi:uncharacterized protein I206_102575 [Kwoniella pini CBS 10737]|uniref:Uncharacterized protein n=1 Tax=Kwoniella pini CBS 10737 TaxID=1296096 RepID=A0A1B9I5S1_9TREE|nr:uncharacterized protein I206_02926 [Kwoniella pini CBS 10737]OCF50868.1 hypothetical protein I206_02926 [Kwoniella pini CBS 10737]
MAPFSPLPPSHIQISKGFQPPKFPMFFGQTKLRQHDFSQIPLRPSKSNRRQTIFQGGHLSFGILICLFISSLWLIAAFSAAQLSLSPPSPSDLVYLESEGLAVTDFEIGSSWGEVGLFETNSWRRIRNTENQIISDLEVEGSNRWKRNEAVLEKLKESTLDPPKFTTPILGSDPITSEQLLTVLVNEPADSQESELIERGEKTWAKNRIEAEVKYEPDFAQQQSSMDSTFETLTSDQKDTIHPQLNALHEENKAASEIAYPITGSESTATGGELMSLRREGNSHSPASRRHRHNHEDEDVVDGGI